MRRWFLTTCLLAGVALAGCNGGGGQSPAVSQSPEKATTASPPAATETAPAVAAATASDQPAKATKNLHMGRITMKDRFEAAKNLKAQQQTRPTYTVKPPVGGVGRPTPPDIPLDTLYFGGLPNWANSPLPDVDATTGAITGGIRKFVNSLPGLGASNANDLGNYIPIATKDTNTFNGSDYYKIGLVEYSQKVHSDLPPTKFRGYKDLSATGADANPHYLGPLIIAQKNRPSRIKFTNLLPTGTAGDLFIPTDTTAMGAGLGPDGVNRYTENRANLHLHGGNTPWISDGTPHQWITPAGEDTPYKNGISLTNVPDMPDPGAGSTTYYYPNQQSGRLLFYHDHAYGITRLNVYAGEAAGYLITDDTEQGLIDSGVLPGSGMGVYTYGIPLIIQDKTFVPDPAVVAATDPTWVWGPKGNLWFPHVYMPNQNPNDLSGANAMGRWDYGAWFWPPYTGLVNQPIVLPNGIEVPNLPNPSLVPEAFMDTPMVNGTPYPYLNVERKAYRFRILNACNDRFLNLQLYIADPTYTSGQNGFGTEVKMVDAFPNTGLPPTWPVDSREGGVPDPAFVGPNFIQIGNESGLLAAPVVIENTPIGYNYNRRDIVVLNVENKSLFLGPAERADVIVDFSSIPDGAKVILYNDSPAPVPANDPRNDYYTGNPDFTSVGGTPSTLPGYGPNVRTIMQFRVAGATAAPAFDLAGLQAAFNSTNNSTGAYASAQHPPLVPESGYGPAFNANYQDNFVRIQDNTFSFATDANATVTTVPLQPKAIQELFEVEYGRMNSTLGVELPNTNIRNQTTIPYGYIDPPTEILKDGETQYWKITHNGVDTHAIHFHLFDVQVLNRVGWDGAIRAPDANETGWKDTVRMNPLEDIAVALRPVKQTLPFELPNSVRPLDVTRPLGSNVGFTNVDPKTGFPVTIVNRMQNFGWEYVWHCHLLGHEENDMMRPTVFVANPTVAPSINPPGGTYGTAQNVTLSTPTSGASIAYTLDGTDPVPGISTVYTGPVAVGATMTLKAIAYLDAEYGFSTISSATYTIGLVPPVFSPPSGTYSLPQNISISHPVSGVTIKYTTDGSDPSAINGIVYTTPIPFTEIDSTTIKAIAMKAGILDSVIVSSAYSFVANQAQAPTFSPAPGFFTNTVNVTLNSPHSNAVIRYTTDGSTPTQFNGTLYTGPIAVTTTGTVIKAVAFVPGSLYTSPVASGTYTLKVGQPAFSPNGGNFTQPKTVAITSATPGTLIRFTLDGSTPTITTGTVYSVPFTVSGTTTIKAAAFKTGYTNSNVSTSAPFNFTALAPTFNLPAGTYNTKQYVTIATATPAGQIRYTLDGSTPTSTNGTLYTTFAVPLTTTTTLKAVTFRTGYATSPVTSVTYTFVASAAAAPTFTPGTGTYTNVQAVTLASASAGATIRYTTDGTVPTQFTGTIYPGGPIYVGKTKTLKAVAYLPGVFGPSSVSFATYTIKVGQPVFSPNGGTFAGGTALTMNTSTTGAQIRYTLNGTTPTATTGFVYSSPIAITETTTVTARGFKANFEDSNVTTKVFTVNP